MKNSRCSFFSIDALWELVLLHRSIQTFSKAHAGICNYRIFKKGEQAMSKGYTPPPRTILEVYQNLPEGTLAQLIHNQIYISPASSNSHQKVLDTIYRRLGDYVEANGLGETRVAPFNVYLNRRNAYQPDIIFISSENVHKLQEAGFYGAPDLVIEILSPGTWRFDKEDKKDEYERSGVQEYWMVDPADKTAEGFYLEKEEFQPLPSEKATINFSLFSLRLTF